MLKEHFISASIVLFGVFILVAIFTFFFYHYIGENGKFTKTYYKKTNKPFIALLFGILSTILLANAITLLVIGLVL